jgi:hypothetical protein
MLTKHRNNTVDSAASVLWFGVVTSKSDKCECECDARKPRTKILVGPNASNSALHACHEIPIGHVRYQTFADLG